LLEALADASAELFLAQAERHDVSPSFGLGCQLPLPGGEGLEPLLDVTTPAAVLLQAYHTCQLNLGNTNRLRV
jgi:hypothetical protein